MLYAAKCYWPGISAGEFEGDAALRLADMQAQAPMQTAYLGSLLFVEDELVLGLYRGSSRSDVMRAATQAQIPCERVMESMWVPSARVQAGDGARRRGRR